MDKELLNIVDYGKEERNIEFKEDQNWNTLKIKIIKTIMALANIRNGGYIVIGMKELDNGLYEEQGISSENLMTFDRDTIAENVNNYAEPSVNINLKDITKNGKKFLFIIVDEFSVTPVLCKKDDKNFNKGIIYYRSTSKIQTSEIKSFEEMKELTDFAILKGVKKHIQNLNYIGISFKENLEVDDEEKFKKQRGE